jgi:hypothetical protein
MDLAQETHPTTLFGERGGLRSDQCDERNELMRITNGLHCGTVGETNASFHLRSLYQSATRIRAQRR